ncbi:F0F1 ATP synthase subunit B [Candidatus Poribacteria bacterium]|nr:F0F1 ATP synthase subunit B [Candidatus Poribacteria bacterium]
MTPVLLLGSSAGVDVTAQVITTIITFLLVMWTLKIMVWKPILTLLDERRHTISNQFYEIDKKMAGAKSLMTDYEERLKRIDDEARERHNKAVDEGRRMAQELIEKARAEAEEITEKAKTAMGLELEKARLELRRDAVELTLAASGKLLAQSLDDDAHRRMVSDFITGLEKRQAS